MSVVENRTKPCSICAPLGMCCSCGGALLGKQLERHSSRQTTWHSALQDLGVPQLSGVRGIVYSAACRYHPSRVSPEVSPVVPDGRVMLAIAALVLVACGVPGPSSG